MNKALNGDFQISKEVYMLLKSIHLRGIYALTSQIRELIETKV